MAVLLLLTAATLAQLPVTPLSTPPEAGPGLCCYGGCGSGNCQRGWCGESQDNCEESCGGEFCPAAAGLASRASLTNAKRHVASASTGCTTFKDMPSKFEASGSAYVNGLVYSVSDEGTLAAWQPDGTFVAEWTTGGSGDWEGLAVTDWNSNYLYIAQEYRAAILEWDLNSNSFTGRQWTFPGFPEDSGAGLEGIAYVASQDEWWAGSQDNGKVYRYTCDLGSPGACSKKSGQYGNWGLGEISGLGYDFNTDTVYALSDDDDEYVQVTTAGQELRRGAVSISHPEGIAAMPDGKFILSDDGGSLVSCTLGTSAAV